MFFHSWFYFILRVYPSLCISEVPLTWWRGFSIPKDWGINLCNDVTSYQHLRAIFYLSSHNVSSSFYLQPKHSYLFHNGEENLSLTWSKVDPASFSAHGFRILLKISIPSFHETQQKICWFFNTIWQPWFNMRLILIRLCLSHAWRN